MYIDVIVDAVLLTMIMCSLIEEGGLLSQQGRSSAFQPIYEIYLNCIYQAMSWKKLESSTHLFPKAFRIVKGI